MNEWVSWVIQSATLLLIGALGYFMKRDRAMLDEKINKQDEKIDKVSERLSHFEDKFEKLPFTYTTREDFIRATTNIERKLDKILDRLPNTTNCKEE